MPRPTINLDGCRDEITALFEQGATTQELQDFLADNNIQASSRTIYTRLRLWGLQRYERTPTHADERRKLHTLVAVLFYYHGYSDAAILRVIREMGTPISERGVRRLRKDVEGYRKFYGTPEEREASDRRIAEVLQEQIDSGEIEGLGQGLLQVWVRQNCNLHVARRRLWYNYRTLRPAPTRDRRLANHARAVYAPQGPNYRWHLDGHDKLKNFGIQIYAAVDAYSRYIIWAYVGISNRTNISVLTQYARTCKQYGIRPQRIRSDRGVELICTANLQYQLVNARVPDGEENIPFQQCHEWGTSKENSRVEKTWEQLQSKALRVWGDYFHGLQQSQNYIGHQLAHRIAFLAIYTPIIRRVVDNFVRLHNGHYLRRQKNRPWSVSGNISELYFFPPSNVQDFAVEPEWEILDPLLHELDDIDLDEYLPPFTLNWCTATLNKGNFPTQLEGHEIAQDGETRLHVHAYTYLRDAVIQYMAQGEQPDLQICPGFRLPEDLVPTRDDLREWLGGNHTDLEADMPYGL